MSIQHTTPSSSLSSRVGELEVAEERAGIEEGARCGGAHEGVRVRWPTELEQLAVVVVTEPLLRLARGAQRISPEGGGRRRI
jgi:hypothetical protein